MYVDGHGQKRVDQRYRVSTRSLGSSCKGGDVGHVRRQLRYDREGSHLAHRADDVVRAIQVAPEGDPAFLDVRTGDIELDGGYAFVIGQDPGDFTVFVDGRAADVDEDHRPSIPQLGQLLAHETM